MAIDTGQDDHFGTSVAIAGDMAIVSAPYTVHGPTRHGTVYTFRWNGSAWLEESSLHPAGQIEFGNFGYQLALEAQGLAASAAGTAYVFQRDTPSTWRQVAQYIPSKARMGLSALGWNGLEVFAAETAAFPNSAILVFREHLSLGIVPGAAKPGDRLDFVVCSGQPAAPLILAVTEVDDSPLFFVMTQGRFDDSGRFTLQLPLPPGIPEAQVTFRAAGFSSDGTIRFSEPWDVYFE